MRYVEAFFLCLTSRAECPVLSLFGQTSSWVHCGFLVRLLRWASFWFLPCFSEHQSLFDLMCHRVDSLHSIWVFRSTDGRSYWMLVLAGWCWTFRRKVGESLFAERYWLWKRLWINVLMSYVCSGFFSRQRFLFYLCRKLCKEKHLKNSSGLLPESLFSRLSHRLQDM